MKNLIRLYFFCVVLMLPVLLFGQQTSQFTQYMYNTTSINPAYAGTRGVISFLGLHRSQWVGFPGAPISQVVSVNAPIGYNEKIGVGFSVINDKLGTTSESYFNADFSYNINFYDQSKLSFGIKAGGHLLNVDFSGLRRFNENDLLTETNIDNRFSPNLGLGIYYYSDIFYVGLSAPNLLETKHFDESSLSGNSTNESFLASDRINYYFMGGLTWDLGYYVKFKPAVLGKMVFGSPVQIDVSANFLLYERITAGLAYRLSAAVSAMVGYQLKDNLMLGFAYDRETTKLGKSEFNDGSYEFFLRFELPTKERRFLTPRFF